MTRKFSCTHCPVEMTTEIEDLHGSTHYGCLGGAGTFFRIPEVTREAQVEAVVDAARQLLNDITAMQDPTLDQHYGPFRDTWCYDDEGAPVICWPNLAISAAALRQALERLECAP